jgi:nucleotide-binding universal stress UspA family protein
VIELHLVGLLLGFAVVVLTGGTLHWMLHPPSTRAERAAQVAEAELEQMIGSIIVVFSQDVHSEHMMLLAARLARRERAELLAAYVIEVPHTLPLSAEMEPEHRAALETLATADAIGRKNDVEVHTEVIRARLVSQGVLELARRKDARLIVLGSFREGKYAGAPLARAIEVIAAQAQCDVLIGVQSSKPKVLAAPAGTIGTPRSTNGASA